MNLTIRDLASFDDFTQVEAVEREVWAVTDRDAVPLPLAIATQAAGNLWLGAFDGAKLAGFVFAFLGLEEGRLILHSHLLAVRAPYRDLNLGSKLKRAQRERALALGIQKITWTFDPLQSKNAHLNFAKLGAVSDRFKPDFYGPETSSMLHRNGTDRLWMSWALGSRRVRTLLQGKSNRTQMLDTLSTLAPLILFNGSGRPARSSLSVAIARQRIAIEVPSDIGALEKQSPPLARDWRLATRWAFSEALKAGFFVAEFCRTVRGQQGPGVYLLEKGAVERLHPGTWARKVECLPFGRWRHSAKSCRLADKSVRATRACRAAVTKRNGNQPERRVRLFRSSGSSSAVERQLPKLDVMGSIPISRSIFPIT
jgi:predicted GNAT superfamily acetyltransferase